MNDEKTSPQKSEQKSESDTELSAERQKSPPSPFIKRKTLLIILAPMLLIGIAEAIFWFYLRGNPAVTDPTAGETTITESAGPKDTSGQNTVAALYCSERSQKKYLAKNGNILNASNDCQNQPTELSNNGKYYVDYKVNSDKEILYLHEKTTPDSAQKVFSVNQREAWIEFGGWLEDDSGFLFMVNAGNPKYDTGGIDSPYENKFYLARLNSGGTAVTENIYTSDGFHALSERIAGFDVERNLLINYACGSGGCFNVTTVNIKNGAKKTLPDEKYYGGFDGIFIDYKHTRIYKLDSGSEKGNGTLISQNYLDGSINVIKDDFDTQVTNAVVSDDFKYVYMSKEIRNITEYIEPTKQRHEIVRYNLSRGELQTVLPFQRRGEVKITSVSPDNEYLVYEQQNFFDQDQIWPNNIFVVDIDANEQSLLDNDGAYYDISWLTGG